MSRIFKKYGDAGRGRALPGDRQFISLDAFQHELPDKMGAGRQEAFEVAVGPHVYSECMV